MWDIDKVYNLVADQSHAATFFCGGARNTDYFIHLFDAVFVLEIDFDTLNQRLAARPDDQWGGTAEEGKTFARWQHKTGEGLPESAIFIDATAPVSNVVHTILTHTGQILQ